MAFDNESLRTIFANYRTIAVVGLSNKASRASFTVARYMQAHRSEERRVGKECRL